jgi:hypothetical protein
MTTDTLFAPKSEDQEYKDFLTNHKREEQEATYKNLFSGDSKPIYEAALNTLTKIPQPFTVLKNLVNKATGLDEAFAILDHLVQAGVAVSTEIDHKMSGVKIKHSVKYAFALI